MQIWILHQRWKCVTIPHLIIHHQTILHITIPYHTHTLPYHASPYHTAVKYYHHTILYHIYTIPHTIPSVSRFGTKYSTLPLLATFQHISNFRQLLCTQRENHEFQSFKVFQMNLTFYSNIRITIICFYNIQSTPVFSALVVFFSHVTFKSMPGGW